MLKRLLCSCGFVVTSLGVGFAPSLTHAQSIHAPPPYGGAVELSAEQLLNADLAKSVAPPQARDTEAGADEQASQTKAQMTLRRALRHAYLNNPTLKAARAALRAVDERLPQAYAGWKPTVTSEASITASDLEGSNFGPADGSTAKDYGVSVNQPLFRGGRTFAQVAAARHAINAQKALVVSEEQDILLSAASVYADVQRDEVLLNLSRETHDIIDKELEATRDRFEVGELTRTDISQAEARLARADSDVINARGNLNASRASFVEVIGVVPENLKMPEMEIATPDTLEAGIAHALNDNPLILFSEHAHEASKEDISDVFGELLPSLSLSGAWQRTRDPLPGLIPETTSRTIGLSASIPLYQAGSVRSRVRQAKQTANQRYIEILEARRRVEREVVSSWAGLQAAKAGIRSRRSQVEASKVAQEGVRAEAEFGARTVLDTLDADQELFEAEVALANAQRDELVARFTLLSSLGQLQPETLGFADDSLDYDENRRLAARKIFDINVDRVEEQR